MLVFMVQCGARISVRVILLCRYIRMAQIQCGVSEESTVYFTCDLAFRGVDRSVPTVGRLLLRDRRIFNRTG